MTIENTTQFPLDVGLSELCALDHLKVSRHYQRGSVLFAEGQKPQGIYVLREGRAKVSIASAEGKTLVLRIAEPGDLLGINATLTGQPYRSSVETLDRCHIDFIAREHLLKLLERDKRVYFDLVQALSRTLSSLVEHTRLLVLSECAAEKLARLLVKWCDDHGTRTEQGIRIDSGLTQEEIAQMICASRETVTRLLSEFKRKRIVSLGDNALVIRNRKALEAVARC
jgi:CRP/FNR family transcriptional regulator